MVGVGNIVSVGGTGGNNGGSGGFSGIQELNGQTGPSVTIIGSGSVAVAANSPNVITIGVGASGVFGVNGIGVEQADGNFIIDGAALSGLIEPSGGIGSINGQIGPDIDIQGVNGIEVMVDGPNSILIDGVGASGAGGSVSKFAASFSNITSGVFNHNLDTMDVIVQLWTDSFPRLWLIPDQIKIENSNQVSVLFNRPQSGRVVII